LATWDSRARSPSRLGRTIVLHTCLRTYFAPCIEKFKGLMQEKSGFLKINFDALDDTVLYVEDFQLMFTDFKAGVGFRNAFKVLKN
jgi:hypothetical protein